MLNGLKIEPTRYSVTLDRKGVGICTRAGSFWVFMCQLDGQMYKGDSPIDAISKCKYLQNQALAEKK